MHNSIRKATFKDLGIINEIYNDAIISRSTADIFPISMEKRIEWFNEHDTSEYPVFVAEHEGNIIGWVSLSAYRKGRMALKRTSEVSYYVHKDHRRKGVGAAMLGHVIANAKQYGFTNLLAIILEHNIGSVQLVEKYAFKRCGFLPEVADFDGDICGHLYYLHKV